jgi:hypothetical protein
VKMSDIPQTETRFKAASRVLRKFFIFEYVFVYSESLELNSRVLWRYLNVLRMLSANNG